MSDKKTKRLSKALKKLNQQGAVVNNQVSPAFKEYLKATRQYDKLTAIKAAKKEKLANKPRGKVVKLNKNQNC
jgi:hypothetical protein